MNKRFNTLLFILGATVLNIVVTLLCFIILFLIVIPLVPQSSQSWVFALIFVVSIVASIFVYRVILKLILKKVDMDKYFDPIFGGKSFNSGK